MLENASPSPSPSLSELELCELLSPGLSPFLTLLDSLTTADELVASAGDDDAFDKLGRLFVSTTSSADNDGDDNVFNGSRRNDDNNVTDGSKRRGVRNNGEAGGGTTCSISLSKSLYVFFLVLWMKETYH